MERKTFIMVGIGIALAIAIIAVFFASSDPDGLESTALVVQGGKTLTGTALPNTEVKEATQDRLSYTALLPDYGMGDEWGKPGEIIAMVCGVIIAFGAVFLASKLIARRDTKET